jgi:hypothetical protein
MAIALVHTAVLVLGTNSVSAQDIDAPLSQWTALSVERLDTVRGGFTSSEFTISFGIQRLFFVNDELVSQVVLHVPQLGQALTMLQGGPEGQAQSALQTITTTATSASSGPSAAAAPPGNPPAAASTVSAPGAASGPATAPASQLPRAPVSSPTPAIPSAPTPAVTAASTPPGAVTVHAPTPSALVIQSGVKNFVDDRIAQSIGPGLATVIQNNVDKQILRAMTVVNIRISGIRSLDVANSLSSLNQQLRRSGP